MKGSVVFKMYNFCHVVTSMEIACRATRQFAQHRSIATILFVLKTWKLVDTVILTREYSNYAYIVHQTQQNCHIDEV